MVAVEERAAVAALVLAAMSVRSVLDVPAGLGWQHPQTGRVVRQVDDVIVEAMLVGLSCLWPLGPAVGVPGCEPWPPPGLMGMG